ncbi:MAG: nitroreductase/quinone reductase family protein [Chloroflexota bacterium]|nr:nitroreductase/quinone reductase family protein [Chloroflexota bacterium]
MSVCELTDGEQPNRLWRIAVEAYPPYEEYQQKTKRMIPVFLAEPKS